MCVHSVRPGDGTHKSGFEEGGPFVGQTPQPTHIILKHKHTHGKHKQSNEAKGKAQIKNTRTLYFTTIQTVICLTVLDTETAQRIAVWVRFPALIRKINRWTLVPRGWICLFDQHKGDLLVSIMSVGCKRKGRGRRKGDRGGEAWTERRNKWTCRMWEESTGIKWGRRSSMQGFVLAHESLF